MWLGLLSSTLILFVHQLKGIEFNTQKAVQPIGLYKALIIVQLDKYKILLYNNSKTIMMLRVMIAKC